MDITELRRKQTNETTTKLTEKYDKFEQLLHELRTKDIPVDIVQAINQELDILNFFAGTEKEIRKHLGKAQSRILVLIERKLKLVTKNYYRNTWMVLGMSAFGLPMGIAFGVSMENMAMLGIGIPIGMAIGIAIGTVMDKKAEAEGRQLDVEITR